ncbi:DNA mismatch repair protein MutL [Striga asiatica]|uniref:DNA mismatch repair protein MutL n=1 Tax=Striga asiatica TaxID=4170 RepID=A0A5A7QQD8_STRAF|nr:DNA mismatch repair protein MutL [Striga asiatica]
MKIFLHTRPIYQRQNKQKLKKEKKETFLLHFLPTLQEPLLVSPPCLHLHHMGQKIGPRINGPRKAPMNAVIIQSHILIGPVPVPARMPIGPQQHGLRGVHQPQLLPPYPHRRPKLLQLDHVKFQIRPFQNRFLSPKRPPPHAVAALVPQPVLEVRRSERPEDRDAVEALPPVGEVGDLTVAAADGAAALVVDGGAGEPVTGAEDEVVEAVDLGGPRLVWFVEAGVGRAVRVALPGPDQEWGREVCESKVVIFVSPALEVLVGGWGDVDWVLNLWIGRIPHKSHGLISDHIQELKRVENGQFTPVGLPFPLQEIRIGPPVFHAVLVLVYGPTRLVSVVRGFRVRHPFACENVAFFDIVRDFDVVVRRPD